MTKSEVESIKIDREQAFIEFTKSEQFIELVLKVIILKRINIIIETLINSKLKYKFITDKEIEKANLYKLIEEFQKLFPNEMVLIRELNDLKNQRNVIMHNEFSESIDEMSDVFHIATRKTKLVEACTLSDKVFKKLMIVFRSLK